VDGKRGNLIGTVAGFLTTGSFIPQVVRVWSHAPKPADDVSLGMFSVMTLGISLWIVYGTMQRSIPLIVSNAITFLLSALVLAYKLIYG
jgi:MtN3 and saliva related transmembrane protein